jgi:hypothetical protein
VSCCSSVKHWQGDHKIETDAFQFNKEGQNMQTDNSYQLNPSVVCTELDDGAVLLDVETKYYYHLNDTSLLIWNGFREKLKISQIAKSLIQSYEVDEQRAVNSIFQFAQQLEEEGLITSC